MENKKKRQKSGSAFALRCVPTLCVWLVEASSLKQVLRLHSIVIFHGASSLECLGFDFDVHPFNNQAVSPAMLRLLLVVLACCQALGQSPVSELFLKDNMIS